MKHLKGEFSTDMTGLEKKAEKVPGIAGDSLALLRAKAHAEEKKAKEPSMEIPKEGWAEKLQLLRPEPKASGNAEPIYSCVFVESGFEELVVHTVEYCGYGEALALRKVMPQQKNGIWRDVNRAMLPGYIFVRGEAVNYRLRRINHVIRLLQYADGKCALRGNDLAFAEQAFQTGGTIPKLQARWEGNYVQVTDALLQAMNGTVLRVDKRHHYAEIEIDLVGNANRVWLGLDLPDNAKAEVSPEADDSLLA